jgi:hypothetical protein
MVHVIALFIMVQNPSPGPAGRWAIESQYVARVFGALAGPTGAWTPQCVSLKQGMISMSIKLLSMSFLIFLAFKSVIICHTAVFP